MKTSTERTKPSRIPISKGKFAAKEASPLRREKLVDATLKESFPASDPPSYMGGAVTGGPKKGTLQPEETNKS